MFIDLKNAPKAELHVHLRGAMSPKAFKKLADTYGVKNTFESKFTEEKQNSLLEVESIKSFVESDGKDVGSLFQFTSYLNFLKTYLFTSSFFRTKNDIKDLIMDVTSQLVSQNIVYAEITVSAWEYVEMGITLEDVFSALREGEKEAEGNGLYINWIIDLVRNFGSEKCMQILKEVANLKHERIVGINLGGDERGYPPEDFEQVYKKAKSLGFKLTVHSGEGLGAESVKKAISLLKPDRIGHGVRAIESDEVVSSLAASGVPLEVCPTSNILLGIYDSMDSHPIKKLFDAGVIITLSSDDPGYFGANLNQEIENIYGLGFSSNEVVKILRNGFEHSFIKDRELKNRFLIKFDEYIKKGS